MTDPNCAICLGTGRFHCGRAVCSCNPRCGGPCDCTTLTADPDVACEHPDFEAEVDVNRLAGGDSDPSIVAYSADIRVRCAACHERFRWIGVKGGMSPAEPRCGVDEFELRAPIRPSSSDPDFGLGIPGFAIEVHRRA